MPVERQVSGPNPPAGTQAQSSRERIDKPCRLFATNGTCRYGERCKFRHDTRAVGDMVSVRCSLDCYVVDGNCWDKQRTSSSASISPGNHRLGTKPPSHPISEPPLASAESARHARGRGRGRRPWSRRRDGHSVRPDKDDIGHISEERTRLIAEAEALAEQRRREAEEARLHAEQEALALEAKRRAEEQEARRPAREVQERARQERAVAKEAERRARFEARASEEANFTLQRFVSGSFVTFSAGLNVANVIAGFDCCKVRIKGLPSDAKEGEVVSLFTQQGVAVTSFQVLSLKQVDDAQEAEILIASDTGRAIAVGQDGIEFRESILSFEVVEYNRSVGMGATFNKRGDSETLKVSWFAPSRRYAVTYSTLEQAETKVKELNGTMLKGRRLKVEMNSPQFTPNSIIIGNLPLSVPIYTLQLNPYSGIRSIKSATYNLDVAVHLLSTQLRQSGGVRSIEPIEGPTPDGLISLKAHFLTWEDASRARDSLDGRRDFTIGNGIFRCFLPDPLTFNITIPSLQYAAQRGQYDDLVASIKDKKACNLHISGDLHGRGVVRIRLGGSVKQAVGVLKVRVESLAAGEQVQRWHSSWFRYDKLHEFLSNTGKATGSFIKPDRFRCALKVYGNADAIGEAKKAIEEELARLAGEETTFVPPRASFGYFIRQGVKTLNETYGENSATVDSSARCIILRGGDEVRHACERLVREFFDGAVQLSSPSTTATCPVCYDQITSPFTLGCGHTYCTSCLNHFLSNAAESRNFPLICVGEEATCTVAIAIATIQKFLPPSAFNHLLEVIFSSHVENAPQSLRYCRTPDCTQVYRCSQDNMPNAIQCPSCFGTTCSACHKDGHEGMTCADWKVRNSSEEQERLNRLWVAEQRGKVKKCPKCSIWIEKSEGCNHMTCKLRTLLSIVWGFP
jgi:hypothetical protein